MITIGRSQVPVKTGGVDREFLRDLYLQSDTEDINVGQRRVHARRIPGRFRNLKWLGASLYLIFFFGPFLRWGDRQAILFDIPNRKYYLFSVTIWPQDIWMLAVLLLTFFITLFVATALAGRLFCGYLCWQTVWIDVFTWIEEKLEGLPRQRRQLDTGPWTLRKARIKLVKHSLFLMICALTGVAFTSYFIDVYDLWGRYFSLQGPPVIWAVPIPFLIGSYIGVAHLREQFCFWLCPYARIQGVMTDSQTILPTYDVERGEPRHRVTAEGAKDDPHHGDCIMCGLCVAVCPTGVDIRKGQQEGCITCGMCIDACDTVMEKIDRPKGLIRYTSMDELFGVRTQPLYRRPRILLYLTLLVAAWTGVAYGLMNLSPLKLTVLHERQPLYVLLSDGSIQNKYTVKILNKTEEELHFTVAVFGLERAILQTIPETVSVGPKKVGSFKVLLKARPENLPESSLPIQFRVQAISDLSLNDSYESVFVGPHTS
jgi:cytochrome c oxidase accessory protein FixG